MVSSLFLYISDKVHFDKEFTDLGDNSLRKHFVLICNNFSWKLSALALIWVLFSDIMRLFHPQKVFCLVKMVNSSKKFIQLGYNNNLASVGKL